LGWRGAELGATRRGGGTQRGKRKKVGEKGGW